MGKSPRSYNVDELLDEQLKELANNRGVSKSEELNKILRTHLGSDEEIIENIKDEISELENEIDEKREELSDLKDLKREKEKRLQRIQRRIEESSEEDSGRVDEALDKLVNDFVEGRLSEENMQSFRPLQYWSSETGLGKKELFRKVKEKANNGGE